MGPFFFAGRKGLGCCQRILHTKWARNMKRRSMKTPPTQIRKFRVILGELISFLSMSHANSIVEEETGRADDKGKIASVYLNRLSKGMKLSADPTVKYALRDFELKRIYTKYLSVESPYNTYKYSGLPPGPICTPSSETIDAVLNAPKTNYLYFVAKPDFSGYSNFSETFEQHLKYAREYQKSLDEQIKIGQAEKEKAGH